MVQHTSHFHAQKYSFSIPHTKEFVFVFATLSRKIFDSQKISRFLEEPAAMDSKDPKDTSTKASAVAAGTTDPVSAAAPPRKGANSLLFNSSLARLTFLSS